MKESKNYKMRLPQRVPPDSDPGDIDDLTYDFEIVDTELKRQAEEDTAIRAALTAHKTAKTLDHPDGSVTDAKIGPRSIGGLTGALQALLTAIGNAIQAAVGGSTWNEAPDTTLKAAKAHADDAVRHLTAAERARWNDTYTKTETDAKDKAGADKAAADNKTVSDALTAHEADISNSHKVTKTQVGLGNVPNVATNDQTPTYTAPAAPAALTSGEKLSAAMGKLAAAVAALIAHLANKNNPHGATKVQVGLGNVTNDVQVKRAEMGAPGGVATLGSDGLVPAAQLPSYVDDVLEYASLAKFPASGETGKIYVALDTNLTYRWSGTAYVEISKSLALGETASTAYPGSKGKAVADDLAATKTEVAANTAARHTHGNKSVLDGITAALVTAWNGAVSHVSDAVKHITAAERTAWNAAKTKADAALPKSGGTMAGAPTAALHAATKKYVDDMAAGTGSGDMLKSVYDTDNDGVVDNAEKANGHTVAVDVPAGAKFTDTVYTHPNSGVTAGTYRSVTTNVQGHVTAGSNPTTLAGYGITDAAAKSHTHTTSQITDMPTSLPADGGNADTVDGKHASEFATSAQGAKADAAVPATRKVNGKALSADISLSAADVGALASGSKAQDTAAVGGLTAYVTEDQDPYWYLGYTGVGNKDGTIPVYWARGATNASNAANDADGSAIKSTYLASIDTSGNTIRAKNKNGTVLYAVTPPFATNATGCTDSFFQVARNSDAYGGIFIGKYRSNAKVGLGLFNDGVNMFLTCIHGVSVGYVNSSGSLTFQPVNASAFNTQSSRRYKEHIRTLTEDEARQLLALEPVQFDYIDPQNGTDRFGLIAEDAYLVQPQGVALKEIDGKQVPDAIDYSAYVPQLIKLCQLQQAQIEALENALTALTARVAALEAKGA